MLLLEIGDKSERKVFTFAAPNDLPNSFHKYSTRAMNQVCTNEVSGIEMKTLQQGLECQET
jgi:hypothetical protein